MMLIQTALLTASFAVSAPPTARIVVDLNDPAASKPVTAAIEQTLQKSNFEVVAEEASRGLRQMVAPEDAQLPQSEVSVLEADAKIEGDVSYGEPQQIDGIYSVAVTMTIRLTDLGTSQIVATMRSTGVGMAATKLQAKDKASVQAVKSLFTKKGLNDRLADVGQSAGQVVLMVKGIPNRDVMVELQKDLERALAGAPVRELYYTKGISKLVLGGSKAKAMVGPDIANLIAQKTTLALNVDQVANTRIVTTYDRARTVQLHALVLEPSLPAQTARGKAGELGRYVATQLATFDFARASYQSGKVNRKQAVARARRINADVIIESEVLSVGDSAALTLRVIDVDTGRPIHRRQEVFGEKGQFSAAETLVTALRTALPEKMSEIQLRRQRIVDDANPSINTAQRPVQK